MRVVNGCGDTQGAQKLTVAGLGDEEFAHFCASLVGAKGVRTLRLAKVLTSSKGRWNPAHRWAWLLYVLFNPSSRLAVTSVEISDDDILLSDITAVTDDERANNHEDAVHPDRVKTHSVTRLSLSLLGTRIVDSARGVKALLELVGWPLTHLNLSFMLIDPEHLEMDSLAMDSLHPLLDAYAASKCRVRSLELTRCILSDQSSVLGLTQALKTRRLPLPRRALFAMLQFNQRLRHVVLSVSNDQQTRFASRFRALHSHIPRPLPLSAKCAFLSVVRLSQRRNDQATSRIDSRVVSQIFSLVAETEPRTVVLHVY